MVLPAPNTECRIIYILQPAHDRQVHPPTCLCNCLALFFCKAAALIAVCWCSTMFLMGPLKQLKSMFDKVRCSCLCSAHALPSATAAYRPLTATYHLKGRIVATLVYLAAMALTLISAIYVRACGPMLLLPAHWCRCFAAVNAAS